MFKKRRERLRERLQKEAVAGLLVSLPANRFYLSGFELHDVQPNESAGHLFVGTSGRDIIFTDSRYLEAARRLWQPEDIVICRGSGAKEIGAWLRENAGAPVGFEAASVSVRFFGELGEGLETRPCDGLVESLRERKDEDELACLAESMSLNQRLMDWLESELRPGRSEADIAWAIERWFREHGATENAFPPIVAVNENAALPHAVPSERVITDNCLVLVDCGARFMDYNSDQTRTFWVGSRPTQRFERVFSLVRAAQEAAIEAIRPGMRCCDIYEAAAAVFRRAGEEAHFTHALGHGLGLETHEAPCLSPRDETRLEPGMVVTVEPGLYYPEWGGVRWENVAEVTDTGARVLL